MWPRRSEHGLEHVLTDEDREAQLCDLEMLCSALAEAFETHGDPRASELFRARAVTAARLLSEGWTQADLNELGGDFPFGAWWLHPKVADHDATREAWQDEVARQHALALATASDLRAIAALYSE